MILRPIKKALSTLSSHSQIGVVDDYLCKVKKHHVIEITPRRSLMCNIDDCVMIGSSSSRKGIFQRIATFLCGDDTDLDYTFMEWVSYHDPSEQSHYKSAVGGMKHLKCLMVKFIQAVKRNKEIKIRSDIGQIFKNMDDNSGADVAAFSNALTFNNFKILKSCLILIPSRPFKI